MTVWANPLEALERRTLFAVTTGQIFGRVFLDDNANGVRDSGEMFSPFGQVYLDNNRNGIHDFDEPSGTVNETKQYHFNDLAPGTYRVAFTTLQGYRSFQPDGYNVTVGGGQSVRRTIPLPPPGLIQGVFFSDINADGIRQAGEPLLATNTMRQVLYLDLNNNGVEDPLEPAEVATGTGRYAFGGVAPGQYKLRAARKGQTFTTPRAYSTTIFAGGSVTKNFGVAP
jgi:hypothetical protein